MGYNIEQDAPMAFWDFVPYEFVLVLFIHILVLFALLYSFETNTRKEGKKANVPRACLRIHIRKSL